MTRAWPRVSLALALMGTQRRIETNALLKGYDKASMRSRSGHGQVAHPMRRSWVLCATMQSTMTQPEATETRRGAVVEFDRVTKRYGGKGDAAAVQELSLRVPGGEVCVLVGPSGCGKTTTLKMVNRLVEPSSGRVLLDGDDIGRRDPVELRRRIGYVIQQTGLFPHLTVGANVATVPRLLGWDADRIRRRVDELIDLVGLDPAKYRDRYPVQLSGGERQRIGVARAIATDPPVLLMDEPFGAVDPITRGRLQNEFLRLQQLLGTTILFVTHDIDEAIKMGDRIAVFQPGGRLAQYDTPMAVLEQPADEYVARFVGADRGLKRLSLSRVRDVPIGHPATVRVGEAGDAAARAVEDGRGPYVLLLDDEDRPVGWLSRKELVQPGALQAERAIPAEPLLDPDSTLRDALSAMLSSAMQEGLVVDQRGRLLGTLSIESVSSVLRQEEPVGS
jgi:osmoprotectant transport system ATP-binding protein